MRCRTDVTDRQAREPEGRGFRNPMGSAKAKAVLRHGVGTAGGFVWVWCPRKVDRACWSLSPHPAS